MPYRTFNNWIFNGDINSPIPKDLLKYNSPITPMYIMKMFLKYPDLTIYLDDNLNRLEMFYLNKEEMFKFFKKCVHDFKVQRNKVPYIPYSREEKIFSELRKKFPLMKNFDIAYMIELINKSDEKESIYHALGLEKPKKRKIRQKKKKKKGSITLREFLSSNFKMVKTGE